MRARACELYAELTSYVDVVELLVITMIRVLLLLVSGRNVLKLGDCRYWENAFKIVHDCLLPIPHSLSVPRHITRTVGAEINATKMTDGFLGYSAA